MHVCRVRGNTLERIIIERRGIIHGIIRGARFPNFTWFNV